MEKKIKIEEVCKETVEGVGNAFSCGCIAGCVIYFASGCYLSPRGKRLLGGVKNVRDRAALFGGSIAMWSFIFNASRGLISYYRQADDKWSASFGGFVAGVLANMRGSLLLGVQQGGQYALMFYVIFGLSEKRERLSSKQKEIEMQETGKRQIEALQTQMPRYYLQVAGENRYYRDLHLLEMEKDRNKFI